MVLDPRYLGSLNYGRESYASPSFPGLGLDYSGGYQPGIALASPYEGAAPAYPGLSYDPYGGLQTTGSLASLPITGLGPILPFAPSYTSQISGIPANIPQTPVQATLETAGLAPTGADIWRQLQYTPSPLNMATSGAALQAPRSPGAPLTFGTGGLGASWGGQGLQGFGGLPSYGGGAGAASPYGVSGQYGGAGAGGAATARGYSPGAQRQAAAGYGQQGYGTQGYGQQATGYGGQQAQYGQQSAYGQPYQASGYNYGAAGGTTAAGSAQYAAPIGPNTVRGQGKWMPGRGIDLFARRGEPIYAIQDGTVEAVGGVQSPVGPVGSILLRGQDGVNAQYTHVQPTVPPGRVRKGQQIGVVGDSSMDILGAYQGMPDNFQHLDFQIGHGGPWMITGGDIDANQWLASIGYQGRQIPGQTRGPNGGGGGGFGSFGGYGAGMGPGAQPFNPMSLFSGGQGGYGGFPGAGGGGYGGFSGGYGGQMGMNPLAMLGQQGFGQGFGQQGFGGYPGGGYSGGFGQFPGFGGI